MSSAEGHNQASGEIGSVLSRIPTGLFVMTAMHEGVKSGMLVHWVQPCSISPPMVMVSVRRGHHLAPLIAGAHGFALCQIDPRDTGTAKRFEQLAGQDNPMLIELGADSTPAGAPIIARAVTWMDCRLARHIDIEADHELLVGEITAAGVLAEGEPDTFIDMSGPW